LPIECKQGANLKIPGGDIETMSEISPIVKIATNLPILIAVVYDEELATLMPRLLPHLHPPLNIEISPKKKFSAWASVNESVAGLQTQVIRL